MNSMMANELGKTEINAIEMLFGSLANSVIGTITTDIGGTASKNGKFVLTTVEPIDDLSVLKFNSPVVKKAKYTLFNSTQSFLILVPREIIASLADILTGGDGNDANAENLKEVDINVYNGLISSISKNLEYAFRDIYDEGLNIKPDENSYTNKNENYDGIFSNSKLNFAVTYSLSFTGKKHYSITLVFAQDLLIKNVKALNLLPEEFDVTKIDLSSLRRISDVEVNLSVVLGRTKIPLGRALQIDAGSIVELDSFVNSDVSVYANDVEIAKAQIIAVDDSFGIKITQILSEDEGG